LVPKNLGRNVKKITYKKNSVLLVEGNRKRDKRKRRLFVKKLSLCGLWKAARRGQKERTYLCYSKPWPLRGKKKEKRFVKKIRGAKTGRLILGRAQLKGRPRAFASREESTLR